MKPLNNDTIRKAYFRFSCFLIGSVAIAVLSFYSYLRIQSEEIRVVMAKKIEYDRFYSTELNMVASVDSIYQYMKLFNTSHKINDLLLQRVISSKKQAMQHLMNDMNERDCYLYRKLMESTNTLLSAKDSIRIIKKEEDIVRDDLSRCVKENREISRKLKVGGITYEGN